jgi:hypothetical protein
MMKERERMCVCVCRIYFFFPPLFAHAYIVIDVWTDYAIALNDHEVTRD